MSIPAVLFLTDFGLKDPFVGCMHGAFAAICPQGKSIDLTHGIEPQAIDEAAYILEDTYSYFPAKSLFVCVVDPGVGSARSIIFTKTAQSYYLTPDNGVITRVLKRVKALNIYRVENKALFADRSISRTFHGRDIFAPVAAHLVNGLDFKELGPAAESIVKLDFSEPQFKEEYILCHIIGFDRFGNALTDYKFKTNSTRTDIKHVRVADRDISFGESTYQDFRGNYFAHPNSFDRLEIALGMGSAQTALNLKKGVEVKLFYEKR